MAVYRWQDQTYEVRLEPIDEAQGRWRLWVGDQEHEVQVRFRDGARWVLEIDGRQTQVYAQWARAQGWATHQGRTWQVTRGPRAARGEGGASSGDGTLRAPMPAQVRGVQVEAGQAVRAGETLVLLEAMKMELRVQAPFDGVVTEVRVQTGQAVERGAVLAVVQPHAQEEPTHDPA